MEGGAETDDALESFDIRDVTPRAGWRDLYRVDRPS
jgi:hypothetical protein